MRKTFQYRLYPTATQQKLLAGQLSEACRLYNAALQERREAYKSHGVSLNYYDQAKQLKEIRERGDLGLANYHCCQNVLKRLDKAFAAFFDRVKQGQRAGFPRFKSHRRYDSITFPSYGDGNKLVGDGHLRIQDVGAIKIRLHREVAGKIKTTTVKRECGQWYACFSCEVAPQPLEPNEKQVGIDVGLENFATRSDGEAIPNPQYYQKAQAKLRRAQRKVARRQNHKSKRRRKAILLLQKAHQHVANQRKDFQHRESYKLVRDFGTIVVEDLNVKGLSGGRLAKAVHDVGWSSFIEMLRYKAENAGRQLMEVDANYTSQECPQCHAVARKSLSERVHRCGCGLTLGRDHAAALLILGRGLRLQAQTKPEARASVV